MKGYGFTLIELLAVIVILGILALITVPVVLKLVNNARKDSSIRSAENYIDEVKKAIVANSNSKDSKLYYNTCVIDDNGDILCDEQYSFKIDVDGKKPTSGTIHFSGGSISDIENVQFGKFYISGELTALEVVTKSASLARKEGEYLVGDKITYKGERYYVIKHAEPEDQVITLFKMFPLTKDEVAAYGVGMDGENHAYQYMNGERKTRGSEVSGYGTVPWDSNYRCEYGYYCSDGYCGFKEMFSGCAKSYNKSGIKIIVDNWAKATLNLEDLEKVDGYTVRLLSYEDALESLKFSSEGSATASYSSTKATPKWAKGGKYNYWMLNINEDQKACADMMGADGYIGYRRVNDAYSGTVRPVINLKRSAITEENEQYFENPNSLEQGNNEVQSTICRVLAIEPSTIVGTKYSCEVKDGTRYNFYLLSKKDDNVSLIMDRNICEDGSFASKNNKCLYSWDTNSYQNRYGPRTVIEKLYNATKGWYKIPYKDIYYDDENGNYGYSYIRTSGNEINIYDKNKNISKTILTYDAPMRARLPQYSELVEVCAYYQSASCPSWIVGNLNSLGISGYWTMTSRNDYDAYIIENISRIVEKEIRNSNYGIRPVITVSVSDLS